ncbi:MAG: hypothetical protein EXQ74_01945 [Thermoleophilia bacterium]|nr:hypothetical protein [Thermoleophilia bacterium]
MTTIIRRSVAMSFLIALVVGVLVVPALGDGRQVLADYEDNGQINGCYSLPEYEQALTLIRPDQQQYGAAVDVIHQAELMHIRRPDQPCGAPSAAGVDGDGTSTSASGEVIPDAGGVPILVILILIAAGIALIGAIAYAVVSRRNSDDGNPPADG